MSYAVSGFGYAVEGGGEYPCPGQFYDPISETCVSCPPGSTFDWQDGSCVESDPGTCAPGMYWDDDAGDCLCAEGTILDAGGQCVPYDTIPAVDDAPVTPGVALPANPQPMYPTVPVVDVTLPPPGGAAPASSPPAQQQPFLATTTTVGKLPDWAPIAIVAGAAGIGLFLVFSKSR